MFEINLVPDVKREMLKAQRVRNIILFVSIAVSVISVAVVLILLIVKGGQDIKLTSQDSDLKTMSSKVHEFNNLDQFITIQDQVNKLSTISENTKAASRLFGILQAIKPAEDIVTYSSMQLDLNENQIKLEGQIDAGPSTDGIDYRALESFRKGIALTNYDYGNYVDKQGATIPFYCIVESDDNGNALKEGDYYYANWYINRTNCNPSKQNVDSQDPQHTIRVWRTPKFDEWYKSKNITLDGEISGVDHFDSKCITYSSSDNGKTWKSKNETCLLAKDGLNIAESSNGRNENDNLVLRFNGTINLDPQVLAMSNNHMRFIGPSGQNVTDSYTQIKDMFNKRAADCDKNDASCQNSNNNNGKDDNGK